MDRGCIYANQNPFVSSVKEFEFSLYLLTAVEHHICSEKKNHMFRLQHNKEN